MARIRVGRRGTRRLLLVLSAWLSGDITFAFFIEI